MDGLSSVFLGLVERDTVTAKAIFDGCFQYNGITDSFLTNNIMSFTSQLLEATAIRALEHYSQKHRHQLMFGTVPTTDLNFQRLMLLNQFQD